VSFHIYPPGRRRIAVSAPGFRYWMSDAGGLLHGLAGAATGDGAQLQTGARFVEGQPGAARNP
jgi:hypothetical protein